MLVKSTEFTSKVSLTKFPYLGIFSEMCLTLCWMSFYVGC